MRQYYIVSGIFLILSIIDFALAAPVLVQEKHQASVDVLHIPKDFVTVLWERGGDEELVEWFGKGIKALNKQVDSKPSVAHASSSAAPPGPDLGSTNVLQLSTPNPASSTANPHPVLESPSPWSPVPGDGEPMWPGNIRKRPLTGPDPDSVLPPPKRPALSNEPGQAHEDQAEHGPLSGSFGSQSSSDSSDSWPTESDFEGISDDEEVNQIMAHKTALPKDLDQAHQHQMGHVQQMNPGPNPSLPTEPPSTAESTDPELNPDSQEMDRQAVIYAAKGKAKQLRRVSGTARDVGNAAQRELQPAERSLDWGE